MTLPYYDEDGVTIYHGDALDVVPTLPRVDLCLTDPPYGVTYTSNTGGRRGKEPISNDGTRISLALYRRLAPQLQADHLLWFTRWDASTGHGSGTSGIWDKGTPGMGDLKHWGPSYEMICSAGNGTTHGSRDQSVLRFGGVSHGARRHPTEKPVPLLRYLLEKLQPQTVLDPFMGSGATLEAARSLGIPAIGVEIEERYCEIAASRLLQDTLGGMAA